MVWCKGVAGIVVLVGVVLLHKGPVGVEGFGPFGFRETVSGQSFTSWYVLGETELGLVEWWPVGPESNFQLPRFLNLHQNENCSVGAVKSLLAIQGRGSVLYFNKSLTSSGLATREVTFTHDGTTYSFDPNRMFTLVGIANTVTPDNPEVYEMILEFGQWVLERYTSGRDFEWVAIHNNADSGGFSAESYLPGNVYDTDAIAVSIGSYASSKEFLLFTDTALGRDQFAYLMARGFSVVLQAPAGANSTLTDDGSLSYYAATLNQAYVNVESTAPTPDDTEALRLLNQLFLIKNLVDAMDTPS
mmetsp:Transcript_32680/g.91507  ORF Transcript_32680/g.91507 Transcript_32680/m.91507 type:complete len:302 (-) Transcript_32680:348-1253(-)|eukprot:CAMPEP_0119120410 /NCGR_PEP_ID=MMETSP1310-20130426/1459_1 /TAXON_ID=464262 /ORGANISM="Genus nov. species nov., Strain RCC2339" /LENGTH=301 /DNA_ID=CAMNT_0007109885 /DNA_START=348 /DNA_END=1253 /DNA_ORIENTATION=+